MVFVILSGIVSMIFFGAEVLEAAGYGRARRERDGNRWTVKAKGK